MTTDLTFTPATDEDGNPTEPHRCYICGQAVQVGQDHAHPEEGDQ